MEKKVINKYLFFPRLLFLSLFFFLLIGFFLNYFSSKTHFFASEKVSEKESNSSSKLFFSPSLGKVKTGENFLVELKLNTNEPLLGVELVLNYNPHYFELKEVSKGNFFSGGIEFKKDFKLGKVFYAIGSLTPQKGTGVLLRLNFQAKNKGEGEISVDSQTSFLFKNKNDLKINLPLPAKYIIL